MAEISVLLHSPERCVGWLTSIREVMTDHGTQFYANRRDKNGNADSRFEDFLRRNKIVHILSPVKRPQVNGKIEKWNDTYEKNRSRFDNFDNSWIGITQLGSMNRLTQSGIYRR